MIKPFIGESGIGLVYSDAVIVDEDLNPLDATVFSTRINAQLRKGQKRRIAEVVLNPDIKGCMMAFRSDLRRVLFPIPPNAEKLGWGHDHWFAGIAFAVTGVHVIDRALMSYRRHGKNFGRDVLSTTRFPLLKKISISVRSKMSPKKPPEHTPDMIVARLELMLDRLQMIRSDHIGMIRSMAAINEYIGTHREAIESIRLRGGMRGMGVLNRVSVACRLLRKGWYGKYFSGMISFFKDVLSG